MKSVIWHSAAWAMSSPTGGSTICIGLPCDYVALSISGEVFDFLFVEPVDSVEVREAKQVGWKFGLTA
jgi:hypothetical protein